MILSHEPIDAAHVMAALRDPSHGGVVCFVGVVRDHHDGRNVVRLDYSAYPAMAEEVGTAIVAEAKAKFDARVAVSHRIGALDIGDVAVVVAASAPHRDAAFAAARWTIDEVKRRLPVWKHEYYTDGTSLWVDPTASSSLIP